MRAVSVFQCRVVWALCAAAMSTRARTVIDNLVLYSANKVPRSHALYGPARNLRLKDQLEEIKDNWFTHEGHEPRVRLTYAEKQECQKKLPWIKSYIAGLRSLRQKRKAASMALGRTAAACSAWRKRNLQAAAAAASSNSSYSSANFTTEHEEFKDRTSEFFAEQVKRRVPSAKWIVLDDFPRRSKKTLRTLSAMKKAGLNIQDQAFLCNPGARQVQVATQHGIKGVAQMTCEDAMRTVWRHMSFGAAYLDLCGGTVKYVTSVLETVMPNCTDKCVVGVTITGRDAAGQTMSTRLGLLTKFMRTRYNMTPLAVSSQGKRKHLVRYKRASVVTLYFSRNE